MRPPRHVYHALPSRELERRPPRRIAREDARRLHAERDRRPPPGFERAPPVRRSAADWRRREEIENERPMTPARREHAARRYADRGPPPPPRVHREQAVQFADLERRTRELERELRVLRADRNAALRQAERRDAGRRLYHKPPPRYREGETRYEREPSAIGQRASHRHVDRNRQSADD